MLKGRGEVMLTNALSQEEIHSCQRDGYLGPKFRLSESDLQNLQRLSTELVADNPHVQGGAGTAGYQADGF
jgi:hypothetical protein